jgi:DNA-binding transcriptional LysR family regulator
VRVAETQNFAQAARQLGVAKSVLTARVQPGADLEANWNAPNHRG